MRAAGGIRILAIAILLGVVIPSVIAGCESPAPDVSGTKVGRVTARPTAGPIERSPRPKKDGFYGEYFGPAISDGPRKPAVLLIGGSEGGSSGGPEAELLAKQGYPALSVAYFGSPSGLPGTLVNIPLEYFVKALRWLSRQPGVDPERLIVSGVSRGSEAALLLGVHYPHLVHAVAARVPGNVVLCGATTCEPSWTLGGAPLPYATKYGPKAADPKTVIPVERIRGRLFMVCGSRDQVWPSCPMAKAIEARRPKGSGDVLLTYPAAGHAVGALLPRQIGYSDGNPELDEKARRDAWPKYLAFIASP